MIPGPGKHPVQLSPYGRVTDDFLAFAERLPDRGEPVAPIGILLSYGHGYERVNNACKMLEKYPENDNDRELRELFNVFWAPVGVVEGQPAAPDVQSMPSGRYGNIFDVLVDRPEKASAVMNYPVIWAAGDVNLEGALTKQVDDYVKAGGTLVVNIEAAKKLPPAFLGFAPSTNIIRAEEWSPTGEAAQAATPF